MKMTALMLEAEKKAGKPLAQALPEIYNVLGPTQTAEFFGVEGGTITYWLAKLGIPVRRLAVPPGYRLMLIPEDDLGVALRVG